MSRFVSIAGEQVAELADRSAESGRLSRGRALFRKGSVSDLSVVEGSVIASVRGSEGDVYETTVGTALAPPGVIREIVQANDPENPRSIDDLVADGLDLCPREMDLAFACDCGDWDEPCKHVVAVLLAFADRVDLDESELLRWRGVDPSGQANSEAEVSSSPPPSRRFRSVAQPEPRPESATGADPQPVNESQPQPTSQSSLESQSQSQSQSRSPSAPADSSEGDESGDRTAMLSELEALLGDTVMRVPTTDGSDSEPSDSALDPTLAEFLGVDMVLEPIDMSGITAPDPLFAGMQLGPLADLGPELATAISIITAKLGDDVSSG